eukprot:scaffold276_cov548-Prasinococcus_capsulatus_cf.AAC.20
MGSQSHIQTLAEIYLGPCEGARNRRGPARTQRKHASAIPFGSEGRPASHRSPSEPTLTTIVVEESHRGPIRASWVRGTEHFQILPALVGVAHKIALPQQVCNTYHPRT